MAALRRRGTSRGGSGTGRACRVARGCVPNMQTPSSEFVVAMRASASAAAAAAWMRLQQRLPRHRPNMEPDTPALGHPLCTSNPRNRNLRCCYYYCCFAKPSNPEHGIPHTSSVWAHEKTARTSASVAWRGHHTASEFVDGSRLCLRAPAPFDVATPRPRPDTPWWTSPSSPIGSTAAPASCPREWRRATASRAARAAS